MRNKDNGKGDGIRVETDEKVDKGIKEMKRQGEGRKRMEKRRNDLATGRRKRKRRR